MILRVFSYVGYTVAMVKIYKTYIWTAGKRLNNNNNTEQLFILQASSELIEAGEEEEKGKYKCYKCYWIKM